MTEICFWNNSVGICGFSAQGHTGFAENGHDPVCAAISSALYMTANTITDVIKAPCESLEVADGLMELQLSSSRQSDCQVLLQGLLIHLQELASQYPDEIRLIRRKR